MEKEKYDQHILNLLNVSGYMAYYYQMLGEYNNEKKPGEKAWEATERAYYRYFEKEKYSTFNSFKAALSRYNKKRKKELSKTAPDKQIFGSDLF